MHEKYIKLLEDNTEATDKQIASAAALLTADELSERWIFNDGVRISIDDIKPYLQTKDMLNVNRRAYDYLREEIIANHSNFTSNGNECWGIEQDGNIYILKNRFNSIITDGGFNPQSTLSWMIRNHKIARHENGRRDISKRINGAKAHCICIYVDDIDDYENIENDEDLPF